MTQEEINKLPFIDGWIARDEDGGYLWLFLHRPMYDSECGQWKSPCSPYQGLDLPEDMFPEVQFTNSPIRIRNIIQKI